MHALADDAREARDAVDALDAPGLAATKPMQH
jgi:hypothetical protein